VLTRIRRALINLPIAPSSLKAIGTLTIVSVDAVNALTPIQTWVARAFIDIRHAHVVVVTKRTCALETVDQIVTRAAILTRRTRTLVNIYLTL